MNSYQAQLSAALSRGAELLTGNLVLAAAAFVLLVLVLMWFSRRGSAPVEDEPVAERRAAPGAPAPSPAPRQEPSPGSSPAASPRAAAPASLATATPEDAPPAAVDATADTRPALLVVDDSAVARAKLKRLLEGAGFRVELARDGVEALQLLPAADYAVLITDLEMPNMDGLELIAHVQGSLKTEDLPVIAITGHEALQARVHEVQGLYGLFRKPWNDRELLKRVEALAALRKPVGKGPE